MGRGVPVGEPVVAGAEVAARPLGELPGVPADGGDARDVAGGPRGGKPDADGEGRVAVGPCRVEPPFGQYRIARLGLGGDHGFGAVPEAQACRTDRDAAFRERGLVDVQLAHAPEAGPDGLQNGGPSAGGAGVRMLEMLRFEIVP